MALNIDTTELTANRPAKYINNCVVTNIDALGVGLTIVPRLIEVRLPGFDGALASANWTGTPASISVGSILTCRRDSADSVLTVVSSGDGFQSTANMIWLNTWISQQYKQYNVVRDDEWTMVANKTTTDRPAPQPIGSTDFLLPDTPTWNINGVVDVVTSGLQLTAITKLFVISAYRVHIQDVSGNTLYQIFTINLITGIFDISAEFNGDILTSPGWLTIPNQSVILVPGNEFQFLLIQSNQSGTTAFVGDWFYTESNSDDLPLTGEVHRRLNRTTIRFNKTDDIGGSRGVELLSVLPGTDLTSDAGADYEIVDIIDSGTNVLYDVIGINPTIGLQTWTFTIPTPASTDYVDLTNHWGLNPIPDATANGVLRLGTATPVIDTNAYGFDIEVQEFEFSPDWDLLALSGGTSGGGGGGGVDLFTALLDTPSDYVGQADKFVQVNVGETALQFTDSTQFDTDRLISDGDGDLITDALGDALFEEL